MRSLHGMRQFGLCLGGALLLALQACGEREPESTQPLTEEEKLIVEGARKARVCTGCHGPLGVSRTPAYPSLAGLEEAYLSQQLHAFRAGDRDDPTMTSIARSLSDEEIAALSHYFASLDAPEQ